MNILLSLFNLIYNFLKIIIGIRYFFLKKLRSSILDKNFSHNNEIHNIFSLIFKIILLFIYEFSIFHIHVFIYLIHDSSIEIGFFGKLLRFIIVFVISCIMGTIIGEIIVIFVYLYELIKSIFHLLIWIISLCFFLLTFDKKYLEIITFKKQINGLIELLSIFFDIFLTFFIRVFRFILFTLHFTNILSIIRLIEICKNTNKDEISTNLLMNSFKYIFLDIFILTPGYLFIILLPPIFINTNINIYKKICKNGSYFNLSEKEKEKGDSQFYPKYTIIKNQILFNSKKVFIYIFAIILTIISIPFVWRLHITISILMDLFKTHDFKKFFISYYNNMIDCILPIIVFIPLIIVHLSPIHLKALCDCFYRKKNKKDYNFRRFSFLIFLILFEKFMDIIAFIISITRLLTINFYIYLLRKKYKIEFLFLLFNNESIIENNTNRYNRIKILKFTFFDILISLFIILQLSLGILNPFFSIKIIKDILLYFITSNSRKEIKFYDIELKYIIKSFKNIFTLLFFYFIYLPISLLLNILAFWTLKYNISLLIANNKSALNKIKNYDVYCLEYYHNKYEKKHSCFLGKYFDNLFTIFKSFIRGYVLIFEFIFIHATLFRTFFFWNKFIKKDKDFSFENLIDEQFNYAIMEFIYVPFILVIIILEPWNYEIMFEFFDKKNCRDKSEIFRKLIIIFVNDIILVIIFILLMISIINTIPTILLIIRSIKRKCYPSEENKLKYNLYYKTDDFKTELKTLYGKNVKKFTTTFLFILNILLITRIIPLFKNTWPFFVLFFKKCKNNLVKCFTCKKKKENEDRDKLTQMPYIIVSEICSFLNPKEINYLSRSNKKMNEKTNINYIWENIFYNKCDKKLKEVLDDNDYSKFSHTKFETFKESCKNCYYIILAKKGKVIGPVKTFTDIVEEETIKSIFNIPFIFLIPRIIIFYFLRIFNLALEAIYLNLVKLFGFSPIIKVRSPKKFSKEEIEQKFYVDDFIEILILIYLLLLISYTIILILNLPLFYAHYFINSSLIWIYTHLKYELIGIYRIFKIYNRLYSSYDYLLLKNLLGLLFMIALIILIIYVFYIKIIITIIKCLSCNFKETGFIPNLRERAKNCSFCMLLMQILYGLIYFIIKYLMIILPSLYYIFIDLDCKSNLAPYYIIKNLSDKIYNSNFLVFIQIFLGKYCLNIPVYILNYITKHNIINYLSKNTDIVFVYMLDKVFEKYYLLITIIPIVSLIMYISLAFQLIKIKTDNMNSKCLSFALNIISLMIGILPFYLMYPCFEKNTKRIIFFEIPLLIYGIVNLLLAGRIQNRIENDKGYSTLNLVKLKIL